MKREKRLSFHLPQVILLLVLVTGAAPVCGLDPKKKLTDFTPQVLTTEDGLAQNSVLVVRQASRGYIWLGTYEGLDRFDGVTFTNFSKHSVPVFTSNGILALLEDPSGVLWVGTPNGLLRYRQGEWTRMPDPEPEGVFVLSLCRTRDGTLWIGTTTGLKRLAGNGAVVPAYDTGNGLPHNHVRAMCEDRTGRLWLGTEGGGLGCLADDRILRYGEREGFPGKIIWSMCSDVSGGIWVGTAGAGLVRVAEGRFTVYDRADGLADDHVRAIYQDRYGVLWVGTEDGGVVRYTDTGFETLDTRHGLSNDAVYSIAEDMEGNLWLGTYGGGVTILKDFPFSVFHLETGYPLNLTRSVFEDRLGRMWIGTVGDGLVMLEGERYRIYGRAEGLQDLRVWSIAEDSRGTLWFGTYGGGLYRLRDGRIRRISAAEGLSNDIVRAVLVDRRDNVWVGTNGGGIDIFLPDGNHRHYTTTDGLSDDFVFALAEDDRGAVWAGMYNGTLTRITDEGLTTFGQTAGLAAHAVWSIYPDRDGVVWLGTNSGGVKRFQDGRFVSITMADGLYDDVAFEIVEDRTGDLWMNCNRGFYRASKAELNEFAAGRIDRVACTAISRESGLKSVECAGPAQPAACLGRDGKLWFATTRGAVRLDPEEPAVNAIVPPVIIEQVIVDGEWFPVDRALRLRPGTHSMEIIYTALSFKVPEMVRFRYKMDGFDRNWSPSIDRRRAYYTNLPPGEYVFRVQACNNDGVWNREGARLSFIIEPYFYQRFEFFLLSAVCLILLAAGFHWLRMRALRIRQRALENEVRERTRELSLANDELQQANEMKSELLNMVAHDLKNPLQGIQGFVELMQDELPPGTELQEYADMIARSSREMLQLIHQMLESARLESGRVQPEWTSLDPARVVTEVINDFRVQSARKRQRLHLALAESCRIRADEEHLREIIANLVSNAVKFSPPDADIHVTLSMSDGRIRLQVRDEGPGFTAEELGKVFGKFQRLSARPTGGESSSGLGLYIVRQLVELHDGTVSVTSEEGRGSVFTVILPCEKGA